MPTDNPTFIDLFAGCGGISLGLSWAGWEGVFAIEYDEMAFDSLRDNLIEKENVFPEWPEWLPKEAIDAEELITNDRYLSQLEKMQNEVTLLTGGPPCQGFSVAGARDGKDEKNNRVEIFLDIAEVILPPFLLIENVEGMTRPFESKPGSSKVAVADEVMRYLREDMDYLPFSEVVDASKYGVPQTRERLFIFAIRKDLIRENGDSITTYDQTPLFSENGESDGPVDSIDLFRKMEKIREEMLENHNLPADRPITVGEALSDIATDDIVQSPEFPNFKTCKYGDSECSYSDFMRKKYKGEETPDSHRFTNHSDHVRERYELIHSKSDYGRVSRKLLRETGTKKHRVVYLNPNEPAPTVTTSQGDFLHFYHPRIVTVREMARLQSFPDWFEFRGRYTINGPRRRHDRARVSQVGNAVPPLLAEAVGRGMKEVLDAVLKHSGQTTFA